MTTAMVVMEPGSTWPGQIGDSMTVVAFSPGGEDLLLRTRERLDALHRSHQCVHVAALACSTVAGDLAAERRADLARVLLESVRRDASGRLILCACQGLREELLALAGTLTEELRGSTATVSVRFQDE